MAEEKNNIAIDLKCISKKYKLYANKTDRMKEALSINGKQFHKEFYALSEINLQVQKGEILGIVGKNGSGKSTLLKIISGILQPSTGSVKTVGRVIPLLELGSGFNPEFTGLENIYFYNSFLGFSRKETDKRLKDIIDFADIGDFLHQPLKTYSSGMKARLAFAVSINIDPDILILDEILSVGDELFRRKSYAKMESIIKSGKTIIFVSHSLNSIIQICNNAILLHKGKIIQIGTSKEIVDGYQKMIYNNGLLPDSSINSKSIVKTEKKASESETYFLKNFKSKTKIIYPTTSTIISNVTIYDSENKQVNIIKSGEKYRYSYRVKFLTNIQNVFFGMQLKTEKGLPLINNTYPYPKKTLSFTKNDNVIVEWEFNINLLPGIYYLNCGVASQTNDDTIYHGRIVDAYVFKIIKEKSNLSGLVYSPFIISLKKG